MVSVTPINKLLACLFNALFICTVLVTGNSFADPPALTDAELKKVLDFQQRRVDAIDQVINSVVAIYDEDRGGGGSGVVITPTGITLTNHHVIIGAGVKGWGGIAGDKMFRWKLIGTDPGGDVSLIQMIADEEDGDDFKFPFTPLGDSDVVEVGDWALAMGNPFILTEDQSPTVTLGIVSGVKRYQSGAGKNQLVYGNCIQVDSSINPGNSGGPLFNFSGEVIGINGRGSFQDRGRVNVGLGYAISSNQIKNFIPELLATKLVEHGTLDATFSDRGDKVVCSTLSVDSPAAAAGLTLGDEMLEFEGVPIKTANQFTNLICTLPEGWPARMKIRKADQSEVALQLRLFGLPYAPPSKPAPLKKRNKGDQPTQEEKVKFRQMEMAMLLSAEPGTVRNRSMNAQYVREMIEPWQEPFVSGSRERCWYLEDSVTGPNGETTKLSTWLCADGRFVVENKTHAWIFDGDDFHQRKLDAFSPIETLTAVEAKLRFETLQAIALSAGFQEPPFSVMGDLLIDGSDFCGQKIAYRFVASDQDDDPFYMWLTGTPYSNDPVRIRKCSADIDCDGGGVLLEVWESVLEEPFSLPLVRHKVQGLSEEVLLTITNDKLSEIPIKTFEELIAQRFDKKQDPAQETDAE